MKSCAEPANWYRYVTAPDDTADEYDDPTDWDTYYRIIATPATTPAGWDAKALAYAAWDREGYDDEEPTAHPRRPSWDLCCATWWVKPATPSSPGARRLTGPCRRQYSVDGVWIGCSAEEKARIDAELEDGRKAREAEEAAAKQQVVEEPMTRERAEEFLASRTRLRDLALEMHQEAVDRLAAFEVPA